MDTLKHGDQGADVRTLQTKLNALGDNLAVDGDFGDDTFESVCDFQTAYKLEPDGIVGPLTWAALDQQLAHQKIEQEKFVNDKLFSAGKTAIARALAMWQSDIYDPSHADYSDDAARCKLIIDKFIRGVDALDWTWEREYTGDGDFEWCGAFAAYCWGAEVKQQIRQTYFSSTYRLDRYASYRSAMGEPNTGSGRLYVKLDENSVPSDVPEVRQGDIVIIGPPRPTSPTATPWAEYGQHICLVESFDAAAGVFHTLEGNGNGTGPHGEKQQGVVKGVRHVGGPGWVARRLIRPAIDDLV